VETALNVSPTAETALNALSDERTEAADPATRRAGSIQVQQVSKTFATAHGSVEALAESTFEIAPGEFVSLIGPSGCGKTTLLRMLADLEKPTAGRIEIGGEEPARIRRRRGIGFVFQQPALLEWRSVSANVRLPLEIAGIGGRAARDRVKELLALVGLEKFGDRRPRELSGGMQQRVSIARALAGAPEVLLMDEPFGALDEITRDRMNLELLRIVAETNITVVFVTHAIREAVFLSDRVLIFSPRPGRIVDVMPIPFGRPRSLELRANESFNALSTRGLESLEAGFVDVVA
jgi:NitT/TauT family transport system ATP-binding protein